MKKITFTPDDGKPVDFYIIASATLDGRSYILVSETMDEDADALVLREDSGAGEDEALYSMVEDDEEFAACARVFADLIDDDDIRLEI